MAESGGRTKHQGGFGQGLHGVPVPGGAVASPRLPRVRGGRRNGGGRHGPTDRVHGWPVRRRGPQVRQGGGVYVRCAVAVPDHSGLGGQTRQHQLSVDPGKDRRTTSRAATTNSVSPTATHGPMSPSRRSGSGRRFLGSRLGGCREAGDASVFNSGGGGSAEVSLDRVPPSFRGDPLEPDHHDRSPQEQSASEFHYQPRDLEIGDR